MIKVTQASHGFSVGQAIRYNFTATEWELAEASERLLLRGLVVVVGNDDRFGVVVSGPGAWPAHGLTPGDLYFVGDTPGGISNTPPTTGLEERLFYVPDDQSVEVIPPNGGSTTYRMTFVEADVQGTGITRHIPVTHNLGARLVIGAIYDDVGLERTVPRTVIDENSMEFDLGAIGTLTGTWNVVVTG